MRRLLFAFALVACGGVEKPAATPPILVDSGADTTAASEAAVDVAVDAGAAACGCNEYSDPVAVGKLPAVLDEASGLAVSHKNPGVIWAHNDSGDSARIFAIDEKAGLLGEIAFGGATAIDWEDIAVGPCAKGTCVWVGDFGDNNKNRTDYALYRIEEPSLDGKPFGKRTIAAEKIPFSYPDGSWNSETLLVHPTSGEIYLVTKIGMSASGVYRFPAKLDAGVPVTLERVGTAASTAMSLVTAGDVSPCGDRVLLRTYLSLMEYAIEPGETIAQALAKTPVKVPVAREGQGEAVAYRREGAGYFTTSEGTSVSLSATTCR